MSKRTDPDAVTAPIPRKKRKVADPKALASTELIGRAIRQRRHKSETAKRLKGQRKKPLVNTSPAAIQHKAKVAKLKETYQKSADELQAKLAEVERQNNDLKEAVKGKSESEANHLLTLPRAEFEAARPPRTCICGKPYTSFADVPNDLLMQVFRFLDSPWRHFVLRRICRTWRDILDTPDARKTVHISFSGFRDTMEFLDKDTGDKLPDNILRGICNVSLSEQVTSLTTNLEDADAVEYPWFDVLYARDADLADCMDESEHFLEEVVQRCPNLRSICLINAWVSFAQILNIPSGTHFNDLRIRFVGCVLSDEDVAETCGDYDGLGGQCAPRVVVKDGVLVLPADCVSYYEKKRRIGQFLDDMTPAMTEREMETVYRFVCSLSGGHGNKAAKQLVKSILNRREQMDEMDPDMTVLSTAYKCPDKLGNIGLSQLKLMRPSTLKLLLQLARATA